jgi:hypothetical protein
MFEPTSPLILRRGAITKPKEKRRKRQRTPSGQSQTEAGDSDSIPIPLEGLSVHEPIAHKNSEELYVQSTIFQSNSWSGRNESITRRNQLLTHRKTKQSTVVRNTSGNSDHSTLRKSEASHGNERNTDERVGLHPSVRIEDVVDPAIAPGGGASTSDDSESRKVLVIEKEGEAPTRFVRVSSVF